MHRVQEQQRPHAVVQIRHGPTCRDVEDVDLEQQPTRREAPDRRRQGHVARRIIAGIRIGGGAAAAVVEDAVAVVVVVAEDDAKEERLGPRRRRSRPVAAGRGHVVPVVVDDRWGRIHDGPGKEGRKNGMVGLRH